VVIGFINAGAPNLRQSMIGPADLSCDGIAKARVARPLNRAIAGSETIDRVFDLRRKGCVCHAGSVAVAQCCWAI
jgi:hypothetical protein